MSNESRASSADTFAVLGAAQYVSLATWRKNGREVRTPVWVAGHQDRLYVFSEGDAGKVKRIRNDGRSALATCNVRGGSLGDFASACARIVDETDLISAVYAEFRRKYGMQMWLVDLGSKLTGRYGKRAIIEIQLDV